MRYVLIQEYSITIQLLERFRLLIIMCILYYMLVKIISGIKTLNNLEKFVNSKLI